MNLFLCEPIHPKAYELIKKEVNIIDNYDDIGQCEIIINRNIKMDKQFLSKCQCLKLVIIHGSGYDDVDVDYLKSHNIQLVNTPGLNSRSVAELIVNMMLQLSRKTFLIQNDFIDNKISCVAPSYYDSHELSFKKVGFIGMGHITHHTITMLKYGFENIIYGYSPSFTKEQADILGIHYCDCIQSILKECDFICLNVPLNNDTYHMISYNELSLMKPHSYIINTSRGGIIDTDALYDSLVNHKIAGAAIDVIEGEPISYNHPLLSLNNVIYTPHIGGTTDEALERIGLEILGHIKNFKYRCKTNKL